MSNNKTNLPAYREMISRLKAKTAALLFGLLFAVSAALPLCAREVTQEDYNFVLLLITADSSADDKKAASATKALISFYNADVNTVDPYTGKTPLMNAASIGHTEVAKKLIEHGADVNAKDDTGATPLMLAAAFGHKETAELLLDKGADVNITDNTGATPLMLAAAFGDKDTAELLIDKGADINAKNEIGATALLFAVTLEQTETAKFLIDKGTDLNLTYNSVTVLDFAENKDYKDIVKYLKSKGAKRSAGLEKQKDETEKE